MCFQIVYLIYMSKEDLALNNLQGLICPHTKPNQRVTVSYLCQAEQSFAYHASFWLCRNLKWFWIFFPAELVGQVLMDLDASTTSLGLPVGYASFPVDVVVFIRVESSIIRFNCVPMSRVECMIQVPSLETVFSTKGTEENFVGEGTPPLKAKSE